MTSPNLALAALTRLRIPVIRQRQTACRGDVWRLRILSDVIEDVPVRGGGISAAMQSISSSGVRCSSSALASRTESLQGSDATKTVATVQR